jgi:4-hydroxy-4-methyl-2-oxoglutarate aldolase
MSASAPAVTRTDKQQDDLAARLGRLDARAVSCAFYRLGLRGSVTGVTPLVPAVTPLARPVITVRVGTRPDCRPRSHLGATAPPGDVVVVDHRGRLDVSAWGGLLSLAARQRGAAGVIVDRARCDVDEARAPTIGRRDMRRRVNRGDQA